MNGCRRDAVEDEPSCEVVYARLTKIKKECLEVIEARYAEWRHAVRAEEVQLLVENQRIREAPSRG